MKIDPECVKLARHFLPDDPVELEVRALSATIQDCIEDWVYLRDRSLEREQQEKEDQ